MRFGIVLRALGCFGLILSLKAQPLPATGMALVQAVESALRNYPSVQVAGANERRVRRDSTRAHRLSSTGGCARAGESRTRTNIFGILLPQSVVPNISGPPLNSSNFGTLWAAPQACWSPGSRSISACVERMLRLPTRGGAQSEATRKRTEFEVAVAAADAHLTLAAAQENSCCAPWPDGVSRQDISIVAGPTVRTVV